MQEIYFTGTIERIIFENPSNFYKILLLNIDETNADVDDYEIIVTGTMADVLEGEDYCFYGQLVTHPKYGQQLQLSHYERSKPTTAGLVRYFSSQQFKGIGQRTAEKIVELYGENTIDAILEEPEKLQHITGLSTKNRQNFLETLQANYGTEVILSKLAAYGIPNKLSFQIQDKYKEQTLTILEENPYQLVEEIQGMGFSIADKIAANLGIDSHSPKRFRAGLLYSLLQQSIATGDTYVEARDLLENTLELLEESRQIELDPEAVAQELTHLITEGKLQQVDTKIFDNSLFFAEVGIQKHITRLMERSPLQPFAVSQIDKAIAKVEENSGIIYDSIQKEAIKKAINHPIFILTGGPGTGKTTVINGIIAVYALLHELDLEKQSAEPPILLAAPTGRAAKRMNELTGLPSATIHRHLGLSEEQTEPNRDDYLEADFVIIDEFSMVDTWLANQLFQSISSNTQLLIVGDAEQLPSVSPGQVLADLLKIPQIPSMTLEKIFRQAQDSTIVHLANHIRQGILPTDFRNKQVDRSYFEARSEQIPAMVQKIMTAAIKSGIPASEVQILAPMYRGAAGIDQLNKLTQELLNPLASDQLEFPFQEQRFRKGDRILHLTNDAENNVFNGDLGYINDLLPAKYSDSKQDELTIQFDSVEITYPRSEWYKITLAYAMSIHKSQGSEFQVVILPLTHSSQRMLQRNLLYTAITRSKSKLILLGQQSAFEQATQKIGTQRKTFLAQRFSPETTPEPPSMSKEIPSSTNYRLTAENLLAIDPMIGITPEDLATFFRI